jgi:hypothetical protein
MFACQECCFCSWASGTHRLKTSLILSLNLLRPIFVMQTKMMSDDQDSTICLAVLTGCRTRFMSPPILKSYENSTFYSTKKLEEPMDVWKRPIIGTALWYRVRLDLFASHLGAHLEQRVLVDVYPANSVDSSPHMFLRSAHAKFRSIV